jgi:hypothetical protein
MANPSSAEIQTAINWLMNQTINFKSGDTMTVMKWLKGDPNNRTDLTGSTIASLLARYLDEMTR